jgi:NADPH:quinone reductase-like Zn-dependent oxidoreductase
VAKPVPGSKQVRIRVVATAVTSSDCYIRGLNLPFGYRVLARLALGLTAPRRRILGMVLAGQVESAGPDVTAFGEGNRVFGLDRHRFGTYAEYVCWPEGGVLALLPAGLTYREAAAVPYGGLLALHYLRAAGIRSGQRVVIYGASGAVGTSAVQLARHFGADVTGVCGPASLGRNLGADRPAEPGRAPQPRLAQRLGTLPAGPITAILAALCLIVARSRPQPADPAEKPATT